MFDFDKQLPPPPVQQKKLLLQISWDCVIACLDEKVPSIVHVHVLLHPVREISEEILKVERETKIFAAETTILCYQNMTKKHKYELYITNDNIYHF